MSVQAKQLAEVMVKFGLSYAKVGDMELRRPDAAVFSSLLDDEKKKKAPPEPDERDELTHIQGLSAEAQDAMLRLQPLPKVGT